MQSDEQYHFIKELQCTMFENHSKMSSINEKRDFYIKKYNQMVDEN